MGRVVIDPQDARPAEILRLLGEGKTKQEAAALVGISRRTVSRWLAGLEGFADATERAQQLGRRGSTRASEQLAALVAEWTPGGLMGASLEKSEPSAPPLRVAEVEEVEPVEPDVLDAAGRRLNGPRRSRGPRPPTRDEWLAQLAAMATDEREAPAIRCAAIRCVTASLFGGPGRGLARGEPVDTEVLAPAVERDRGVPASVWQDARRNFLGPAADGPADAALGHSDTTSSGSQV
jgi:transposase